MPFGERDRILMGREKDPPVKQIDAKPSEFRRLPKYERWVLWYGIIGGLVLLVFMMAALDWPWMHLAQLGLPVFVIAGALALLTKNTP